MEIPDLMIYKEDYSELKFAEVKRLDTHDIIRESQIRGVCLLALLFECPVEVIWISENGKEPKELTPVY
jgi:hypothetical protein